MAIQTLTITKDDLILALCGERSCIIALDFSMPVPGPATLVCAENPDDHIEAQIIQVSLQAIRHVEPEAFRQFGCSDRLEFLEFLQGRKGPRQVSADDTCGVVWFDCPEPIEDEAAAALLDRLAPVEGDDSEGEAAT